MKISNIESNHLQTRIKSNQKNYKLILQKVVIAYKVNNSNETKLLFGLKFNK